VGGDDNYDDKLDHDAKAYNMDLRNGLVNGERTTLQAACEERVGLLNFAWWGLLGVGGVFILAAMVIRRRSVK
jgi:hypothetical protein